MVVLDGIEGALYKRFKLEVLWILLIINYVRPTNSDTATRNFLLLCTENSSESFLGAFIHP